jgi:hypothetical protein
MEKGNIFSLVIHSPYSQNIKNSINIVDISKAKDIFGMLPDQLHFGNGCL